MAGRFSDYWKGPREIESTLRDEFDFHTSTDLVESHVETIGRVAVHGSRDRSNETALIRAAQAGDSEAFEQLVCPTIRAF
jgi:hypothetical protein